MSAAVKYVRGKITADGARAVEELLDHPQLLERVRDEAGVTDAKAKEMVKKAGKSSSTSWTCRMDCWLHIRQFLKLKDVASG
ncbi:hypothetical protein MRX96_021785 [Rhipicephalus microplus]